MVYLPVLTTVSNYGKSVTNVSKLPTAVHWMANTIEILKPYLSYRGEDLA